MEVFAARLKWLREGKGLTQKQMAEKLGMTQSSYSKYEYNLREPNLETLSKLPTILGESVDFLLGVTDFDEETQMIFHELRINAAQTTVIYDEFIKSKMEELAGDSESDEKKVRISKLNADLFGSKLSQSFEKVSKLKDHLEKKVSQIPYLSEETKEMIESATRTTQVFENPDVINFINRYK